MVYVRKHSVLCTHLENSEDAERCSITVHGELGPIVCGLWYRPPGSPLSHITSLSTELEKQQLDGNALVLFGDLNVLDNYRELRRDYINHSTLAYIAAYK